MNTLGKKIQLLAFVGTIFFSCKGPNEQSGTHLPFSVIKSDDYSTVKDESVVRITNENDLSVLWNQVKSQQNPIPPVPSVDFSKDMCLFIFLGSRPTAGYSMEVSQLLETDKSIRLRVKETAPNDFVAQVITSPYLVVTLAKNPKPIESTFTHFW
jgi:hypothetical protein